MLKREKINHPDHLLFEDANNLYLSAFPLLERRPSDYHAATLLCEQFHAEAIKENDQFVGIMYWWDLPSFRYIEHFAILPELRGQKLGERALTMFMNEDAKQVILEVEIPEEEMQRRRIAFYQRFGFHLSLLPYQQPPYRPEHDFLPLHIMTYPEPISQQQLDIFLKDCHPIIHFKNYK